MTPFFQLTLSMVAAGFDVPSDAILSRAKREPVVTARQTLWYLVMQARLMSHAALGRATPPGFNHGTVTHGVKRIRNILDQKDKRFFATIARLIHLCEQPAALGEMPTFERYIGADVVIKNVRTHKIKEAHVQRVTPNGDGVKLKINGCEPEWFQQREWFIIDRIGPVNTQ